MDNEKSRARARGALLGLAVGDAVGMPFEGMSAAEIRGSGWRGGFMAAPSRRLGAGQWTDDTKMAVQLALGILDGEGIFDPERVAVRYLEWFQSGDLRGIGGATMEAMTRLRRGVSWLETGKRGRWAAGNGTAMRCAPIGVFRRDDPAALRTDAARDAVITHNNPEAVAGSRAVCLAVARGVNGIDIQADPVGLVREVIDFIGQCELAGKLAKAATMLGDGVDAEYALELLGTSGFVVDTVASALFCALRYADDFEAAVTNAVLGGGDTDTVAAVAGSVSGALLGAHAIPDRLLDRLEARDMLVGLADRVFDLSVLA